MQRAAEDSTTAYVSRTQTRTQDTWSRRGRHTAHRFVWLMIRVLTNRHIGRATDGGACARGFKRDTSQPLKAPYYALSALYLSPGEPTVSSFSDSSAPDNDVGSAWSS